MTPAEKVERIAEIQARHAKSTPGEWSAEAPRGMDTHWFDVIVGPNATEILHGETLLGEWATHPTQQAEARKEAEQNMANIDFAAHAHQDIPFLLQSLSEAEKRAEEATQDVTTVNDNYDALGAALQEIAQQCGRKWDTGYDERIVIELVRQQITTLQAQLLEMQTVGQSHEGTIANLKAQLLVVTGEPKRLREALEIYADANNWNCPRCGKRDQLNCFMGRWTGPVNPPADPDFHMGEGHGYDIARKALDTVSGEPPADTLGEESK